MTEGAERIIGRVLDDAQSKAENIKAEARVSAGAVVDEARQKAERQKRQILDQAGKEAEEQKRRILGIAQLESRKDLLATKQSLIAQAFSKTLDELTNLDDQAYQALLKKMLLSFSESGTENVACSAKDCQRLPQSFWQDVNEALRSQGKKGELKPAEETRDIRGGFVLLTDGVEVNCSFEALLAMKRDELEPEVAAVLFK